MSKTEENKISLKDKLTILHNIKKLKLSTNELSYILNLNNKNSYNIDLIIHTILESDSIEYFNIINDIIINETNLTTYFFKIYSSIFNPMKIMSYFIREHYDFVQNLFKYIDIPVESILNNDYKKKITMYKHVEKCLKK